MSTPEHLTIPSESHDAIAYWQETLVALRSAQPTLPDQFFDIETGRYDVENDLFDRLKNACSYMEPEHIALVERAATLTFLSHWHQKRDSGDLTVTHAFAIATEMAERYHFDEVTIAAALLHDAPEDTPENFEKDRLGGLALLPITTTDIAMTVSPQVADVVTELTNVVSKKLFYGVELGEEVNRLRIIHSFLDDPRVIFIKVFDRLHNMRTLQHKKDPAKRYRTIRETEMVYIPLAKLVGLYDEAHELASLSVINRGPKEASQIAVLEKKSRFFRISAKETKAQTLLCRTLNIPESSVHVRSPWAAELFPLIGKRGSLPDDEYYLNVDIEMPGFPGTGDGRSWKGWGTMALTLKAMLTESAMRLSEPFDENQFRQEEARGDVDSLRVDMAHSASGQRMHIRFYPEEAYRRQQTSLAVLFRYADISLVSPSDREVDLALQKYRFLRERLGNIYERLSTGAVTSDQLLRFLAPRSEETMVHISFGDSREGIVRKGATVMDAVKSMYPDRWMNLSGVRSGEGRVSFFETVSDHASYTLDWAERPQWVTNPVWMYSFVEDTEGATMTHHAIEEALLGDQTPEKHELRSRLMELGEWRLLSGLPSEQLPLYIGVSHIVDVSKRGFSTERDMLIAMGLGNIPEEELAGYRTKLVELNNTLVVVQLKFHQNKSGQSAIVSDQVRMAGINALAINARRVTGDGSEIVVVAAPHERAKVEHLLHDLEDNALVKLLELYRTNVLTLGEARAKGIRV